MAKDVVKHYRLTTDDAAAFRKKAEEAGMTESDYFRLLITQQPSDYPEIRGGIKVLINEVNRIGVNINEIVFNNNSNLYRTADKERLIALYAAFERNAGKGGGRLWLSLRFLRSMTVGESLPGGICRRRLLIL